MVGTPESLSAPQKWYARTMGGVVRGFRGIVRGRAEVAFTPLLALLSGCFVISDCKSPGRGDECRRTSDCQHTLTCCKIGQWAVQEFENQLHGTCVAPADCNLLCSPVGEPCARDSLCCPWQGSPEGMCLFTDMCSTCVDNSDCDSGDVCCRNRLSTEGVCVGKFSCEEVDGIPVPGQDGGMPDSGATPDASTTPMIPSHTVVSGTETLDGNGCIDATGMGVMPVHIALDETVAGPVTVRVTGTLSPVPGDAVYGVSVVQVSTGGTVNGNTVENAHLGRVQHNTLNNEGAAAIFDVNFTESGKQSWTPSGNTHAFEHTVTSDTTAQTMAIDLQINGTSAATVNGTNLGTVTGNVISVLISQAVVCAIEVTQ